ncbi:MAG: hypothetical protein H3C64_14305 [Candidatus Kuenenia stuttgartiensis]|nr:hypothetical protein [Candidatus Kuenenia stuttgartiensis]
MGEVAKGGRTVLFVSHNMGAIANLCSSVLVIKQGCVFFDGDTDLGISSYLNEIQERSDQKLETLSKKILNLPPDPDFELLSIDIYQSGQSTFYTDKPLLLNLKFRVKKPLTGFRIGFDLKSLETDMVIFRSFHDDAVVPDVTYPGAYQCSAVIPENFLSPLSYKLCVLAGIHNVRWLVNSDDLSITINLQNVKGVNSGYSDYRPGILMPKISWITKNL